MPYIGNNTTQTAVDTVDQRFDEFKETSIDASKVQTIFLAFTVCCFPHNPLMT